MSIVEPLERRRWRWFGEEGASGPDNVGKSNDHEDLDYGRVDHHVPKRRGCRDEILYEEREALRLESSGTGD